MAAKKKASSKRSTKKKASASPGPRGREKPVKAAPKPLSRTKYRIRINAVLSGAFEPGLPNFNMHSAMVAGLEDAGHDLAKVQSVIHPGARLQISVAR